MYRERLIALSFLVVFEVVMVTVGKLVNMKMSCCMHIAGRVSGAVRRIAITSQPRRKA